MLTLILAAFIAKYPCKLLTLDPASPFIPKILAVDLYTSSSAHTHYVVPFTAQQETLFANTPACQQ